MRKKGVKRGRQTAAKNQPSSFPQDRDNHSNESCDRFLEDRKHFKGRSTRKSKKEPFPVIENEKDIKHDGWSGKLADREQLLGLNHHCEVERRILAIQAIRDAQIEHVLTQLRVARSMLSKDQLNMPLLQFLKKSCPNTIAVKNLEGIIELERKTRNYDVAGSYVDEKEWRASIGCQGSVGHQSSVAVDDQTVMPTPVGFHFNSSSGLDIRACKRIVTLGIFNVKNVSKTGLSKNQILQALDSVEITFFLLILCLTVKEKFLHSIGIHVSNMVFEENSEVKITDGESSFQTPHMDLRQSSIGITPKTRRLPKRGEILLSVHGSPLGVYCEDKMDTISESDKKP